MYKVDLNSDLGESFGNYTIGCDEDVIKCVSSANVACGFHGGDPLVMDKTVLACREYNTAIGAHPGYPDLAGFGRRDLKCSPAEVKAYVIYQIGALAAFAKAHGMKLQHCKPHGALYNNIAVNAALADAVAEAVAEVDKDIILLGLAGSETIKAGKRAGLKTASEVFADRAYMPDGTLVPRSRPGSMVHDPALAIERTVRMVKEGLVTAITGEDIPIEADSICVHGDNPKAVEFVMSIRARLAAEGITIAPISEVVAGK